MSARAMASMMGAETSDVWLVLLAISGSGISTLRIVNNAEDVVSGGDTYAAFPFAITLAPDTKSDPGDLTIDVCNVDRQATAALRQLTAPATIAVSVVLAAAPSTVELGPLSYTLRQAEATALGVRLTCSQEDPREEPIPCGLFCPSKFPGVFKT